MATKSMDVMTVFGISGKGGEIEEDLVYLAKLAESAERFEDMCDIMATLVKETPGELDVEQRNLLSVAFKNVVGSRRASIRHLLNEVDDAMQDTFKSQIQDELNEICNTIINLLDEELIPSCKDHEAKVFYKKMGGDYYRYLAECLDTKHAKDKAKEFYEQANEIAEEHLEATHPIRLGLALNYSVCLYEIIQQKEQACQLAKKAFDEAISQLDKLQEADYKDSTLIMQLLRDNLTLWTANNDEGDDAN